MRVAGQTRGVHLEPLRRAGTPDSTAVADTAAADTAVAWDTRGTSEEPPNDSQPVEGSLPSPKDPPWIRR